MAAHGPSGLLLTNADRVLPIVPMFHANAWGIPYAIWMVGADLILPGKYLQGEHVVRMVEDEQATWGGGVPTIWTDVLNYAESHEVDFSSLKGVMSGGSAVPRALIERMWDRFGVPMLQGWGMTETSPLAAVGWPPRGVVTGSAEDVDWRTLSGRIVPGVELRIVSDDGRGHAVGRRVGRRDRGARPVDHRRRTTKTPRSIASTTAGCAPATSPRSPPTATSRSATARRTSSSRVASGSRRSSSRASSWRIPRCSRPRSSRCPIRSGRSARSRAWCAAPDSSVSPAELCEFLGEHVAHWQLPERWTFIDAVPKTSVGKFDKKVLRARHADGELVVEELR